MVVAERTFAPLGLLAAVLRVSYAPSPHALTRARLPQDGGGLEDETPVGVPRVPGSSPSGPLSQHYRQKATFFTRSSVH